MKIGIADADLIGRKKHRFPNLACEKISAFYKELGHDVSLLTGYDGIEDYDKVFVSKVFTDTPVPDWVLSCKNVKVGGTGFFFDRAEPLPQEIEHHIPDYHLYDKWLDSMGPEKASSVQFLFYRDCAIGFLTRGCFRKCPFCVNQKYSRVFLHSDLSEFYDGTQKRICLLDDNFFGHPEWKRMLLELKSTGVPFRFRQGLDERLLTDEKCEMLFNSKYDGDFVFAFDNISDYDLIHEKLKMIRRHTDTERITFYVLVGFEGTGIEDIENAWKRVELLIRYKCKPYIMRYRGPNGAPWEKSEMRSMYVNLSRWCNQPSFLKKKSFREFCEATQLQNKSKKLCAAMRMLRDFEQNHKEIADRYFDIRYGEGV